MDEERYSNRQIERLLDEQSKDIKAHIDLMTTPIILQTTKTNGRLLGAEADITSYKIWRGWMTGGIAMLMVFFPVILGVITFLGLRILNVDTTIHTAIDEAFTKNLEVNP